ncbi:MAG: P-type conjugative transfer protein TrbL [Candidatus Thiodiazotropha sp. (ex Dulcina madagascariensis)]|nr:P-type conjugative transfer protein TrbL [Candidatus Thiodiazotropha sp. (ex Dulcina madagascariensis)]
MKNVAILILLSLLLGMAVEAQAAIDNSDLLDNVLARYSAAASGWAAYITGRATWLFWVLVLISMVMTFGMMALQKADIGEFFAEFVRFTLFTGFFWWLLINGPNFSTDIMDSLRQIGGIATGFGSGLTPSSIVDVGFAIFDKVIANTTLMSPGMSLAGIIMAAVILVIIALIGVNMLLLLAAGWILAYGGIFFLGFGGGRWTHDIAINYYKTVLGVAAQLLTMVLLVGIGRTFVDDYYNNMSADTPLSELGVMLIVAVILLMLVNKVPQLIAGIITGASVGGMGIGQFGTGAAIGAAGVATAAASMAGAMIASGATQGAGGVSALMAAFLQANANVASGSDVLANTFGGGGEGPDSGGSGPGGGGGNTPGIGDTPFAKAAGFSDQTEAGGDSPRTFAQLSDNAAGNSVDDNQRVTGGQGEKDADSGNQATEKGSGNSGGGVLAMAGSVAASATRIGADAAANLARGATDVGKQKIGSMVESAKERIVDTTGGRIAEAIRTGRADSTLDGNSLTSDDSSKVDTESEVAAFVNRSNDSQSA